MPWFIHCMEYAGLRHKDLGEVIGVSLASDHACALRIDGELKCWDNEGNKNSLLHPRSLGKVKLPSQAGSFRAAAAREPLIFESFLSSSNSRPADSIAHFICNDS